jgi:hypothetical protein
MIRCGADSYGGAPWGDAASYLERAIERYVHLIGPLSPSGLHKQRCILITPFFPYLTLFLCLFCFSIFFPWSCQYHKMSYQTSTLDNENRYRQHPAAATSPSSFYIRPPIPLDYYAPLPPLSEQPLLELRRPEPKDACFAVSALSPQLPARHASEHDSVGPALLDRFLYQQAYSASGSLNSTQAYIQTPITPAQAMHNLWAYAQTPLTPRNPRNVWEFMNNGQVSQ